MRVIIFDKRVDEVSLDITGYVSADLLSDEEINILETYWLMEIDKDDLDMYKLTITVGLFTKTPPVKKISRSDFILKLLSTSELNTVLTKCKKTSPFSSREFNIILPEFTQVEYKTIVTTIVKMFKQATSGRIGGVDDMIEMNVLDFMLDDRINKLIVE